MWCDHTYDCYGLGMTVVQAWYDCGMTVVWVSGTSMVNDSVIVIDFGMTVVQR